MFTHQVPGNTTWGGLREQHSTMESTDTDQLVAAQTFVPSKGQTTNELKKIKTAVRIQMKTTSKKLGINEDNVEPHQ